MDNLAGNKILNPSSEHETKFVINNSAAHIFIKWLQLRCIPDPKYPAGHISSIYYDTKGWRFLREKINSDFLKTKVRVRWYADIDNKESGDVSFLEIKSKVGSRRKKVRIELDYSGKWLSKVDLSDQKLMAIPLQLRSRGIIFPEPLYPVFQISYKRQRFVESITGARICFDYNISAPKVNRRMIGKYNPFRLKHSVFELKGNLTALPDVLHQLTAMGCYKQSFSKYSICYKKIAGVFF